jgi:hypothetical protein
MMDAGGALVVMPEFREAKYPVPRVSSRTLAFFS